MVNERRDGTERERLAVAEQELRHQAMQIESLQAENRQLASTLRDDIESMRQQLSSIQETLLTAKIGGRITLAVAVALGSIAGWIGFAQVRAWFVR